MKCQPFSSFDWVSNHCYETALVSLRIQRFFWVFGTHEQTRKIRTSLPTFTSWGPNFTRQKRWDSCLYTLGSLGFAKTYILCLGFSFRGGKCLFVLIFVLTFRTLTPFAWACCGLYAAYGVSWQSHIETNICHWNRTTETGKSWRIPQFYGKTAHTAYLLCVYIPNFKSFQSYWDVPTGLAHCHDRSGSPVSWCGGRWLRVNGRHGDMVKLHCLHMMLAISH